MKKEQLLDEILPYLVTYVQEGTLNIAPLLQEMPTIEGVEQLLKLYVLRQQRVIDFMHNYPIRIREKTAVTKQQEKITDEVRGPIMWHTTLQRRITHPHQFVINETKKHTESIEQQVVSYVAATLVDWYSDDAFLQRFHTRHWFEDVKRVMPAFIRAVRDKRIRKPVLTKRTIERMQQHRKVLYREAAHIYIQLEALYMRQFEQATLQQALHEFFVAPEQEETLFELYWIVQIIKQQSVTLFINEGKTRPLARWQIGETTATLYHNKTGSSRVAFSTHIEALNGEQPFLNAIRAQHAHYNEAAAAFFNRPYSPYIWRGRPDFVIEYVRHNVLTHIVIGEVKYTSHRRYMQQGLQELITYMHYMSCADAPEVTGVLCVNDYPPFEYGNIQLVSTSAHTPIRLPKLED